MNMIRTLPAAAMLLMPLVANAQSLLDRSPNVSGDWAGVPGTLYFHFAHRFVTSKPPERKVSNVPTFLLAAGLPKHLLVGFNYSTNSTLAPRIPNEWEGFARWTPLSEDYGAPLDVGGQVGYNNAAEGVDGELSIAKRLGPARLIVAGRGLSDPFGSENRKLAVAGGATFRLGQYVALAGDVASLLDRDSTERVAWSAGVHFAIPMTPHTVSLHATNTPVATLQGSSRGTRTIRYGFEFTIPLTLRRYFGKRAESSTDSVRSPETAVDSPTTVQTVPADLAPTAKPVVVAPVTVPPPPADTARAQTTTPKPVPATTTRPTTQKSPARAVRTVNTGMKNTTYLQPRIQITVGTSVEWKNNDPLPHSVTATDKTFDSGLIQPGKTYRRMFTKAGTYNFFCVPHPFMKGVVVVREP